MSILSLICLASGVGSAAGSLIVPQRSALLEQAGGGLFAIGLCLLGADLPLFK